MLKNGILNSTRFCHVIFESKQYGHGLKHAAWHGWYYPITIYTKMKWAKRSITGEGRSHWTNIRTKWRKEELHWRRTRKLYRFAGRTIKKCTEAKKCTAFSLFEQGNSMTSTLLWRPHNSYSLWVQYRYTLHMYTHGWTHKHTIIQIHTDMANY